MAQFGFRNDAWIAVDEARGELSYLKEDLKEDKKGSSSEESAVSVASVVTLDGNELVSDLRAALVALDSYIKLAPADQQAALL